MKTGHITTYLKNDSKEKLIEVLKECEIENFKQENEEWLIKIIVDDNDPEAYLPENYPHIYSFGKITEVKIKKRHGINNLVLTIESKTLSNLKNFFTDAGMKDSHNESEFFILLKEKATKKDLNKLINVFKDKLDGLEIGFNGLKLQKVKMLY